MREAVNHPRTDAADESDVNGPGDHVAVPGRHVGYQEVGVSAASSGESVTLTSPPATPNSRQARVGRNEPSRASAVAGATPGRVREESALSVPPVEGVAADHQNEIPEREGTSMSAPTRANCNCDTTPTGRRRSRPPGRPSTRHSTAWRPATTLSQVVESVEPEDGDGVVGLFEVLDVRVGEGDFQRLDGLFEVFDA